MEQQITEILEVPMPAVDNIEGQGYAYGGIHGDRTSEAYATRRAKVSSYKSRIDLRECIPCDRCSYCLEIRGFHKSGKECIKGMVCLRGEFETNPYNTCNDALKSKNGRRKVLYDLENAPKGFKIEVGRSDLVYKEPGESASEGVRNPTDGYRGGSNYYKRADGDSDAEGSGKIPKRLMN